MSRVALPRFRLGRRFAVTWVSLASVAFTSAPAELAAADFSSDWASLDSRPTPSWFLDAKLGIFIHWGVYSVPAFAYPDSYSEWYWHSLTASLEGRDERQRRNAAATREFHRRVYGDDFAYPQFAPLFKAEMFDPAEWADLFLRAGARYVVLTSKHHDGFALWPSREASRTWGRPWNSAESGPQRDLLGDLGDSVRAAGLKMGFYYSLYEWFNPLWLSDKDRYIREHMIPQFKDVVSRYRPALIFSDGEWDLEHERWQSTELLAWLFNEAPGRSEVVINDRWGKGIRHKHGGYYTTEYGAGMADGSHPWEENRGIGHSFGYNRNEPIDSYMTGKQLVWVLADLVSRGGNLLLDVGPTADGRIPLLQQARLLELGAWLSVNGEAIYGTRPWTTSAQWTEGKRPEQGYKQYRQKYDILELAGLAPRKGMARKMAFFTRKGDDLYAIVPGLPEGSLKLRGVRSRPGTKVTMLGVTRDLEWSQHADGVEISVPSMTPDELPGRHAYVFKVQSGAPSPE